jgi:hypothetical protein
MKREPAKQKVIQMQTSSDETLGLLRKNLKILLVYLAAKSETPSADLETLLQEVIGELHAEAKQVLEGKTRHLRLIAP